MTEVQQICVAVSSYDPSADLPDLDALEDDA